MSDKIPEYVKEALDYHLTHEHEDFEKHGKAILELSNQWGF
jgi:hypothetical protein